jgi:para-aminobenzoate synthetase
VIRTLLIDNADSFTLNLFHLLADVNGYAPTLVPNLTSTTVVTLAA